MDSNCGPLVSEATALATEPQPLLWKKILNFAEKFEQIYKQSREPLHRVQPEPAGVEVLWREQLHERPGKTLPEANPRRWVTFLILVNWCWTASWPKPFRLLTKSHLLTSITHIIGQTLPWAWLLPVAVVRLHVGDLHAVGWSEDPWAFVTPVKAIRVVVMFNETFFWSK